MHQRHVANTKLRQCLSSKPTHLLERHLPVGLVVEIDRLPASRIVPHNPVKDANRPIRSRLDLRGNLRHRNHRICNLNPHTVPIPRTHRSPAATARPHLHPSTHLQPAHTPDLPPLQSNPKSNPQPQQTRDASPANPLQRSRLSTPSQPGCAQ